MNKQEQSAVVDSDRTGQPDLARRTFLMAAPLGALAVVAGRAGAEPVAPPVVEPEPQGKRGYHETEHIRHYYRTASYW